MLHLESVLTPVSNGPHVWPIQRRHLRAWKISSRINICFCLSRGVIQPTRADTPLLSSASALNPVLSCIRHSATVSVRKLFHVCDLIVLDLHNTRRYTLSVLSLSFMPSSSYTCELNLRIGQRRTSVYYICSEKPPTSVSDELNRWLFKARNCWEEWRLGLRGRYHETGVCIPFETKCYQSFPKPQQVRFMPKLNQPSPRFYAWPQPK